jgi:tetratricopeptide (TPR) repeat protein
MRTAILAAFCLVPGWLTAAEPTEAELANPAWWATRAQAEVAKIADPEEQSLLGQMASSLQGVAAPAGDLPKSMAARFAPHRESLGADADWQFELFAARHYEAANRFPEAIAALVRGQAIVARETDESRRQRLLGEVAREFDSILNTAAAHGELILALESVHLLHSESARESVLDHLALRAGSVDLTTALARTRLDAQKSPREWRLLLLAHCRGGSAADYQRAIRQLLADRAAMEPDDVVRCYQSLTMALRRVPKDIDRELLASLDEQLSRDAEVLRKPLQHRAIARCLVTLRLMQDDVPGALRVLDLDGKPALAGDFRQDDARLFIERRLPLDGLPPTPAVRHAMAEQKIAAGQLDETLAIYSLLAETNSIYMHAVRDLAIRFSERGDWTGVEKCLRLVTDDALLVDALVLLAKSALKSGQTDRATALLDRATDAVSRIDERDRRSQPAQDIAQGYVDVGNPAAALRLAEQECSDFDKSMVLVSAAEYHLAHGERDQFAAVMSKLTAVVARDRLGDDFPAALGVRETESPWTPHRQFMLSIKIFQLYWRAGNRAAAERSLKDGLARAGQVPGAVWRADAFLSLSVYDDESLPITLAEVAAIGDIMTSPADRAMAAIAGGILASAKRKPAD